MKNSILLVFVSFIIQFGYSQKKETKIICKSDNVSVLLSKNNEKTNFYIENRNESKIDSVLIKSYLNIELKAKKNSIPTDCKILNFKTKNTNLSLLTWTEVIKELTSDLSTETLILNSEIWNLKEKKRIFVNIQNIIKTKETVYLDKAKIASETKEATKRIGYEFVLNKDGGVLLKSKTKQVKLVYSTEIEKYVNDVKSK